MFKCVDLSQEKRTKKTSKVDRKVISLQVLDKTEPDKCQAISGCHPPGTMNYMECHGNLSNR